MVTIILYPRVFFFSFTFLGFLFCFLCLKYVFIFCSAGDETQGFMHARQGLYHLSYTSSPFVGILFMRWSCATFAQADIELEILLPPTPE
jgi:hypothetical protein